MPPAPKSKSRRRPARRPALAWILATPSMDDLIRVLGAWRVWILSGLIGAALGAALYAVAPPPYKARATVNVDFHMDQAWPQNTDREQFYYLERETRKLIEIAQSDTTLATVTRSVPDITVQQLRDGAAHLSQPGNGGWHFYGLDRDPRRATAIASSWAIAFSRQVGQQVALAQSGSLEKFITADPTQVEAVIPQRSVSLGAYMLASAMILLSISALGLLLVHPRP